MANDDIRLEYGEALSDEDLVAYFWTCSKASHEWFDPLWEEFDRQAEAYGGNTLSEIDREWLVETKRPPITFNVFAATIDTIVGTDMADEREVLFRGQDLSDFDGIKAEWMTQLLRQIWKRGKTPSQVSDAFQDDLLGGYGFAEAFLDTSKVPIPVVGKSIPVWEMYPDPDAREVCLADGRFIIRERRWLLEEIEARWSNKIEEIKLGITSETIATYPQPSKSGGWHKREDLRRRQGAMVHHFCYKRFEPRIVVEAEPGSGRLETLRPSEHREREEEAQAGFEAAMAAWEAGGGPMTEEPPPEPTALGLGLPAHRYAAEVHYSSYILGDGGKGTGLVLEHKELSVPSFPYIVLTGYQQKKATEKRVKFFGPAKKIFDAQLYLNRALGVYLDILARGSKGGAFIDKSLVTGNEDKIITEMSIPGMSHIVDGDPREGVLFKPVQTTPTGYEGFLGMCIDAISRISLVTDWLKGTATTERSNILITNLQNQATTGLGPLFGPLAQFRERLGILMARLALQHLPASQVNRMIGEVDPIPGLTHEEVPDPATGEITLQPIMVPGEDGQERPVTPYDLLSGEDPFDYDVVVEVGAASTNQKMQTWQILTQTDLLGKMIELLGPMVQPLIPDLIRYFPLPPTMVKSMADKLEGKIAEMEDMQTREGLLEALAQLPPEEQLALLKEAASGAPGQAPGVTM